MNIFAYIKYLENYSFGKIENFMNKIAWTELLEKR